MKIPIYQVDAFTNRLFRGNPAAVCPLQKWLDDETLQAIAAENNVSETAFFVPSDDELRIRWFTPEVEVDLCGHATLAAGNVWFSEIEPTDSSVTFDSMSGPVSVARKGEMYDLDFPAKSWTSTQPPDSLIEALGAHAIEWLEAHDWVAVLTSEDDVRAASPDLQIVRDFPGLIVTAPGDSADFVSRYFAPGIGLDEDPVTGANHCFLTPYWAKRLKKTNMVAQQISARGGELHVEDKGRRVSIAGHAVRYMDGHIHVS